LFSILIIADKNQALTELGSELTQKGFDCMIAPVGEDVMAKFAEKAPDLVLVETDSSKMKALSQIIKQERNLPIIALVSSETLDAVGTHMGIDDFVIQPYNVNEMELRIKRLLHRTRIVDSGELIKCGDLVIDLARCEVSVAGKSIVLTFREYQLLKFLASNRERVYTREALLNKVWGHDYYGGDRTVDVHIRRLRSKIEDSNHTFVETIRSIGYKFRVKSQLPAT
jgi:DNA-binding response OmpR family regulator